MMGTEAKPYDRVQAVLFVFKSPRSGTANLFANGCKHASGQCVDEIQARSFLTLEQCQTLVIISLLEAYDGWTNPPPNIEIESKYVEVTQVLVYSLVFSACLHICGPSYSQV
jgi:hypothetical protein